MEISKLYQLYLQHSIITTDSRDCPGGSIFFALKGSSFNGNEFAGKALEKGCSYAVVDEEKWTVASDQRYILVKDCLQTLKQLANYHRKTLQTPIIGITGTNGKTTTKELVSTILSERFNVLYTLGNYNNEIGVPKTLLRLKHEHQIAVIEMGASHPGDIKSLVDVVEPDFALITNVGRAHLEGFGSFEGVMKTKAELFDYMQSNKPHGIVFINEDNEFLKKMRLEHCPDAVCIGYGQSDQESIAFQGKVTANAPYLEFEWRKNFSSEPSQESADWNQVKTHLIGAYNLDNMLAAISIGTHFGINAKQIEHALSNYIPSNNRSQLEVTKDNKLIVDAYNANPTSMKAAIDNFEMMEVDKKMVILGDMRELGAVSAIEHQAVIDLLIKENFDLVWLVGEEFAKTRSAFRKFNTVEDVKLAIAADHPMGYYILIKGSNGIHLSELPPLL